MLVLARDSAWAGAGLILGHKIDGTQAEYVHVPFADTLTYPAPAGDEQLLTLADILPTGYESACPTTRSGPATWSTWSGPARSDCRPSWEPGSTAPSHVVAIDQADVRLEAAKQLGADVSVNNRAAKTRWQPSRSSPDGLCADVAIEAVGVPATFELAAQLIRPGGRVANIGGHGEPATLHLEDLWILDVTITTGLVDTYSTPTLLNSCAATNSTPGGSSPTSPSTTSTRPTTCSPEPARPASSRCYSAGPEGGRHEHHRHLGLIHAPRRAPGSAAQRDRPGPRRSRSVGLVVPGHPRSPPPPEGRPLRAAPTARGGRGERAAPLRRQGARRPSDDRHDGPGPPGDPPPHRCLGRVGG